MVPTPAGGMEPPRTSLRDGTETRPFAMLIVCLLTFRRYVHPTSRSTVTAPPSCQLCPDRSTASTTSRRARSAPSSRRCGCTAALMMQALADHGIHPGQAMCLRLLIANDGITQRDLARALHVAPPDGDQDAALDGEGRAGAASSRRRATPGSRASSSPTPAARRSSEMRAAAAEYVNATIATLPERRPPRAGAPARGARRHASSARPPTREAGGRRRRGGGR